MAYVAVSGGREAVERAIALLEKYRTEGSSELEGEALEKRMSLLLARIMGEAGFYAPSYAALALKQSEGSPEEAVFLLRAYRSTLPRSYETLPLDGADMDLHRRISAAFKDLAGGQFLGPTYDYTHRLLNFDLLNEGPEETAAIRGKWDAEAAGTGAGDAAAGDAPEALRAPRLSEELRREGLLRAGAAAAPEAPWDITQKPLSFPAPRSARLQALARSDTGFISGLAYAAIRGFGPSHPTVGELRTGMLEVIIPHPVVPGETLCVGEILVTETESLFPEEEARIKKDETEDPLRILGSGQGDRADESPNSLGLASGYGMVFGRNDTKAIAMSILDYSLSAAGDSPLGAGAVLQNQEFVLLHGDSLEMNGFIAHLKLPHYVTFQSKLDRVRRGRSGGPSGGARGGGA
ncbi:MAG: carbon-phosphorus lyase complex subunit PhnI [Spirochaetaceae bacterium]|jgi:alpha-D-ribose 1-methylphosphonate 5-triphosphate synthase subunit PhnI|nr:carbon-phosphorus lyase complex subunit PhnI [Spirochaetaceae bacterium]